MIKSKVWTLIALAILGQGWAASAGDLNWNGLYRAEGVDIMGSEADATARQKTYLLHHLVLKPSFVAADGWTIKSRFDILNNGSYPNSQLGQTFGLGPRTMSLTTPSTSAVDSNSLANVEKSGQVAVNELYLMYQHEFGTLLLGRVPLNFGLGVTYNNGSDPFAHWLNNRDLVGYKVIFGNFFLMPMYGKQSEGDLDHEDDINDYMVHLQYENPDNGLQLGAFFSQRVAGRAGNDAPAGYIGGTGAVNSQQASFTRQSVNIFGRKEIPTFMAGVEAGFLSGRTGVQTAGQKDVTLNGFGIATEFEYRPTDSRYKWSAKTGIASGDNGSTNDRFEGFIFNRNYEVAELMFNHVLGQGDFLNTAISRPTSTGINRKTNASAFTDVEAVSNVFYFSPGIERKLSDRWNLNARFTYAVLNQGAWRDSIRSAQVGSDVVESLSREFGYELDLGVTYQPYDNLIWKTTGAGFWPGQSFSGGAAGYQMFFISGITTKLSIQF